MDILERKIAKPLRALDQTKDTPIQSLRSLFARRFGHIDVVYKEKKIGAVTTADELFDMFILGSAIIQSRRFPH